MIQRILKSSLFIITFLICCFSNHGQLFSRQVMGAKSVAMGQTGVSVPGNNWAVFANPAMMQTEEHHLSFYGFRYLGIAEITDMAASINIQTRPGTFGIGLHRYGFNLFSENRFLLAFKNNLGDFHYGAAINYTHVMQGESYGSAGAIGFDAGLAALIADKLWFGARATNLNQPAYGDTDEELPRELAVGLSYQLFSAALYTVELVKDVKFPVSVRSGIDVEVISSLFARAGFTTEPTTFGGGFGYATSKWIINFGLQQHIPLGLSPALDFTIRF